MSQVNLCSIGLVGLEKAVKTMYERLAVFLVDNLDFGNLSTILEVGCGSGQLTVPFVRKVTLIKPSFIVIALDLSAGPYGGHMDVLKSRLREERLEGLVTLLSG